MPTLEEYRDGFLSAIMRISLNSTKDAEAPEVICVAKGSDGQILGTIRYNGWTVKGQVDVEQFKMTDALPGGVWTDQPEVWIYGEAKPLNKEQLKQVLSDAVTKYYEGRSRGVRSIMTMDVPVTAS